MKKTMLFAALAGVLLAILPAAAAFAASWDAPEWADIALNEHGFLDGGEYILEDPEDGHWLYVNATLRVQIVRTLEKPEKIRKNDYNQEFNCYTAEILCDTAAGELPVTLWADPTRPGYTRTFKTVADIAREQGAVFAVSTDLFTARTSTGAKGVIIRNGDVLYDAKTKHHPGSRPPFDTLALYDDGRVESYVPKDRRAEEYLADGAVQVYTFGPVLVRDGEIPEEIAKKYDRNLNPMHAFGMIAPGHYIDVLCEGRLKSVNGSTGVNMETMARIMKVRGCVIAVNLDGGDTAVMAFMGTRLNAVAKVKEGRKTCEVLAFGPELAFNAEKDEENP